MIQVERKTLKKLSKDNKGFTLVEMIVVLVILAILAAILIPGLLGYIDDAKNKKLEIHGKAVYTAAQAVASKNYAKNQTPISDTGTEGYAKKVKDLSEIETFNGKATIYFLKTGNQYIVQGIKYEEGSEIRYLEKGKTEWSKEAISGDYDTIIIDGTNSSGSGSGT